ncbi:MAG: hypothetical protein GX937_12760, partial [Lentisphaerae bacterium]|nr:hypothetical protein [Lentisphaerota bacterium]
GEVPYRKLITKPVLALWILTAVSYLACLLMALQATWSLAKLWTNLKKTKKSIFIFEVRHTLSTLMHKPHYAEVQPTPGGA